VSNQLKTFISKKQLRLIPDLSLNQFSQAGDRENEFDVIVTNNSQRFTSFQVELKAVNVASKPEPEWYKVDPELCAKKPPGDSTRFRIAIIKAPILSYGTLIELQLKVFSVEFADLYAEEKLRLEISKPRRNLKIYLPVKKFRAFPGDLVKIPVLAYNLSPKLLEIEVKLFGLDPSWLNQNNKLKMQLHPGNSLEKEFLCQIPQDILISSQGYDFLVEAKGVNSGYVPPVQRGNVEILPYGKVEFYCDRAIATIPYKFGLIPKRQYNFATFELEFENKSNKIQTVNLNISESEQKKYVLELPEPVEIESAETEWMNLVARKRRPWLGMERRFLFKVIPLLNNQVYYSEESSNKVNVYPNVRLLDLRVRPIIPILIQILGAIATIVGIWLWWLLHPPSHKGPVNSVRIIGNVGTVISGSSDKTIRRWQINSDSWNIIDRLSSRRLRYEGLITEDTIKAVRVIRSSPRDEDIIVAGLDNGDIRFGSILSRTEQKLYQSNDRVFDLDFTDDSRYLFSVHGSGFINQWDMNSGRTTPINRAYPKFAISAMAVSESQNQPTLIIAAGRYGKLVFWDWQARKLYEINYQFGEKRQDFSIMGSQNYYVDSLSISNNNNILAMADNKGYITLWNVNKMRECINTHEQATPKQPNVSASGQILFPVNIQCNNAITERWSDGHEESPVRSVSLTQEGCYLASTGDNGKVMLWALQKEGIRVAKRGKVLANFGGVKLNTVDAESRNNLILIASDAKKFRVNLYREERMNINADCYK
jgi:WD40 repeat protein